MASPLAPLPPQLPPKKAADRLGVTEFTLCIWRKAGKGPRFIVRNRRIWYNIADLDHWYLNGDSQGERIAG